MAVLGRSRLIVTASEGIASVHHRVDNNDPYLCQVIGSSQVPCPSSPSWPLRVEVDEFLLQNTGKTMSS